MNKLFFKFLLIIFGAAFAISLGCSDPPTKSRSNSLVVENRVEINTGLGVIRPAISVFIDRSLKREALRYGQSFIISNISDGTYTLEFSQAPSEEGLIWSGSIRLTIGGGKQANFIVYEKRIVCTNCSS